MKTPPIVIAIFGPNLSTIHPLIVPKQQYESRYNENTPDVAAADHPKSSRRDLKKTPKE